MTEPNEIIEAIHHCIADERFIQRREGPSCAGCPYEDDPICVATLKSDIQKLLKAQEPRLVTYEDFHSGLEDGGAAIPCWKEARSKTRRSGWAVIVYGKMLADWEMGVARYWTARPTEEQMREEAWPGA